MRSLLLFLHIVGFGLLFGVSFSVGMYAGRARATGDRSLMAFHYAAAARLLTKPGLAGIILTTVSGFELTRIGGFGYFALTPHWLFQMQVLGVLAAILSASVQIPVARRLASGYGIEPEGASTGVAMAVEASAADEPSLAKLRRVNAIVGSAVGLLLLIVVYLGVSRAF